MPIRIVQVDAFTNRPFAGNPAAVCVLAEARPEQWMRDVAREMNLSETAFLVPQNGGFHLRWFTPAVEVALCGHATVASAHVLWQDGHLPPGAQARFHTLSGLLTADQRGEWIELDFPAKCAIASEAPAELLPALGVSRANFVGKNAFDYLVEIESEADLRALSPDHSTLRKLPVRGIIVTARGSGEFDFVSRFFAPGSGIDEDPVTGSAHTALGPHWAERLGKTEFTACQASPRGGVVRVRLEGDRVKLGGQAVTVMTAELLA
ncbi:MAG TPA: PhzF family phenazine biosynthesis protein [Candidatus Sulfopaludibacter sp.]|nr:PhzF family phenazine biosynthesis protein [Candidatus Sulfopaludibacter sp.]